MSKKSYARPLVIISIGLIAIILIGSTLSSTGITSFKLLSIEGFVNKNIICYFKTSTSVLNQDRWLTGSDNSPFLIGSPKLTFIAEDGNQISKMLHFIKMRCNTQISSVDGNPEHCLDPTNICIALNQAELIIKPANLRVIVWSKVNDSEEIKTFSETILTKETVLLGGKEETLSKGIEIRVDQILQKLPIGTYDSLQKITVSGEIAMCYRNFCFPSTTWKLKISDDDSPTFINLKNLDNTIGINTGEFGSFDFGDSDSSDGTDEGGDIDVSCNDCDQTKPEFIDVLFENFEEISTCIIIGDTDCLQQPKFFGLYGITIGIIVIGTLIENKRRQPKVFIG